MPQPLPATTDKDEIRANLILAGIGDRYLEMKLSDFGELGSRWLEAFSPQNVKTAKPLLRQGFQAYINGKGAREFGLTLSAGLLTVFKARVECLHLSDLSDALDNREEDRIAELIGCELLTVSEFVNTSSSPLSQRSAFRVESFLLDRTETHGKSTLLMGDANITQTTWWTARLVTRIQDTFIKESVAQYAQAPAAKVFSR